MSKIFSFLKNFFRKRPLTAKAKFGQQGEVLAAKHLRKNGHSIITRNWRSGRDEIDIVAREGEVMVFVEVKTRTAASDGSDDVGRGYFSVDSRKRNALRRACRAYMAALRHPPAHFRFDIIEVTVRKNTSPELRHHRSVLLFPKHFRVKSHE